jgi:hypothetical protein
MSECKATWWRACKFRPRADTNFFGVNMSADGSALASRTGENRIEKTYVRDVCERCGKTIERADGEKT